MGQNKKVTNLQLIKALSKHCGIYADAARELGISKQAVKSSKFKVQGSKLLELKL